jgi:hypothetical protein
MQKGVDPIGIGVIALGVVMLIVLVVISNNMMPQPLPAPQIPDLNGLARKIEDPLSAAAGTATGMGGAPMMGAPGGFGAPRLQARRWADPLRLHPLQVEESVDSVGGAAKCPKITDNSAKFSEHWQRGAVYRLRKGRPMHLVHPLLKAGEDRNRQTREHLCQRLACRASFFFTRGILAMR